MNTEKREAIEKAVRDLGGVWPDKDGTESYFVGYLTGKLHTQSGRYEHFANPLCTRAEFDHVVADFRRLHGWYQQRLLYVYELGKFITAFSKCAAARAELEGFQWRTEYKPETEKVTFGSGWYDIKNEHERGELPPVGTECEYQIMAQKPQTCHFVGVNSRGSIVIESINGEYKSYHAHQITLRPLRTERDKLIEQAWDSIGRTTCNISSEAIEKLIEAGWRPTEC